MCGWWYRKHCRNFRQKRFNKFRINVLIDKSTDEENGNVKMKLNGNVYIKQ